MAKKTSLPRWAYIIVMLCSFAFVAYYTSLFILNRQSLSNDSYFFTLVTYSVFMAILIFSVTEIIADVRGELLGFNIRAGGPFAGIVIVMIFGIYFRQNAPSKYDLSLQLHGPKGLSDIPRSSSGFELTLIPIDNRLERFTREANSSGQVKFDLSNEYFQADVRFGLKCNGFELMTPDSVYLLSTDREVRIALRPAKMKYTFTIRDSETRTGIEGVRLVVSEFDLDTLTNRFGKIEWYADTMGLHGYRFSISHPDYHWSGNEDFMVIDDPNPFFYLEPAD